MKKKIFNIIFLILIFIPLFVFWNWKRNIYSKEALKLEILGPSEVVLGQEIEYVVKYKNNGNFRLEEPELIFEAPENSLKDGQSFKREILTQEKLGIAIYPGEENSFSFKLRLFGKEGEAKTARATLFFKPKGLKAKYSANTSLTTVVKSVPVTFDFDLPSKIEAGRIFNFNINYFSNVDYPLSNLRVQVEYPKGFELLETKPKSIEKTDFEIPLLNKSEGGRIEISGKITGEVGEIRNFRARLVILSENQITVLKEIEKAIEIIKPSIFIRQEINDNPQYVALPGEWLHYVIFFKNIGEETLENLFLIVRLEGEAFDFQTIRSDTGETKPGNDFVVFDWRKIPALQNLIPLAEGRVDFWIKLKDDLGELKNPSLKSKIFISQIKEEFVTKISSKIEIVQKGFFNDEIFGNSGPLPPQVGKMTTYTISWQVKNYYSDIKNVKVKAKLPQNVSLTGKIFPEEMSSKFSFDPESREIVWSVGDLEKGRGISSFPASVSFQVSLIPTLEQLGESPEIIGEARVFGEDTWTEKILEAKAPPITTILLDDSLITPEMGIVK